MILRHRFLEICEAIYRSYGLVKIVCLCECVSRKRNLEDKIPRKSQPVKKTVSALIIALYLFCA